MEIYETQTARPTPYDVHLDGKGIGSLIAAKGLLFMVSSGSRIRHYCKTDRKHIFHHDLPELRIPRVVQGLPKKTSSLILCFLARGHNAHTI